ncbi:MAG: STAS domain-containing protein [Geminicoccaceae bacterium]
MTGFRLTSRKGVSFVNLGETLDMGAAPPLRTVLQKALAKGQPLQINAGSVNRMSTPCIQVLLAAVPTLETAGLSCVFLRPSDAFIDAFNELGLFPILKQWTFKE